MSLLTALIALFVGAIIIVLIAKFFIFFVKFLAHCLVFGFLTMIHPFFGLLYLLYIGYLVIRWIHKRLSS